MVKKSRRFLIMGLLTVFIGLTVLSLIVAQRPATYQNQVYGHGGDQIWVDTPSGAASTTLDEVLSTLTTLKNQVMTSPIGVLPPADSGTVNPPADLPPEPTTVTFDFATGADPGGYTWVANINSNSASWLTLWVKTSDREKKDITTLVTSRICQWGSDEGDVCPTGYEPMGTITRSASCTRVEPKLGSDIRKNNPANEVNGGTLLICQRGVPEYYMRAYTACDAGDILLGTVPEGNVNFCKSTTGPHVEAPPVVNEYPGLDPLVDCIYSSRYYDQILVRYQDCP